MAAPARGSKRSLEEGVDSKAKRMYSQVGKLHYDLVVQFLKEDNASAADDLIEGLSEMAFNIIQEFAVGNARVQAILSRHRSTRDDNTEMAEVVIEQSGVISSFKNLSQMPRDLMLQQANSFLTNKEATFLSRTNKQTMEVMHKGYKMKGWVDAYDYFEDMIWERDQSLGFKIPPTRFKRVGSLEMMARLPRETTHIEMSAAFRKTLVGADFPPHLEMFFVGAGYMSPLKGVVFPASLQILSLDLNYHHTLKDVDLPKGLKELRLSGSSYFNLKEAVLPDSIESLSLSNNYYESLVGIRFPPNLKKLSIGNRKLFAEWSLVGVVFPESLVELKLGDDFLSSLEGVKFPESLRVLTFGQMFNQELVGLPQHLESLDLGLMFDQPLSGVLPSTLKRLEMGPVWNRNVYEGVEFPAGMLLVMPGKSIQY